MSRRIFDAGERRMGRPREAKRRVAGRPPHVTVPATGEAAATDRSSAPGGAVTSANCSHRHRLPWQRTAEDSWAPEFAQRAAETTRPTVYYGPSASCIVARLLLIRLFFLKYLTRLFQCLHFYSCLLPVLEE
jgi:hypothetical protein